MQSGSEGSFWWNRDAQKPSYVEGIIKAVKELGPYIIISDGLAMPHTRPEDGALDIGCSLITLKEPVLFEGDDVR